MKVLMINGSSNKKGCTYTALKEVSNTLEREGVEVEIIQLGNLSLRDCSGCFGCKDTGKCVFDDLVNEVIEKAKTCDGFIFGTPVYYAHPTGRILSFLDRAFFAGHKAFEYKPGASVIISRRSGTTASFDVMNKYFTINNMPIVSSQYWNNVYGLVPDDVQYDLEGLQTMRTLGRNMVWMLQCIELGKQHGIHAPQGMEKQVFTNFVDSPNNYLNEAIQHE